MTTSTSSTSTSTTFLIGALFWCGGLLIGIGAGPSLRGHVDPKDMIANCMEANNTLPLKDVRKTCTEQIADLTKNKSAR